MNDLGKEGLCGSKIVDLSCTLIGVIVHVIPDTLQGFQRHFSSVFLYVDVHCGVAFLSLAFLFVCKRGQEQPVLRPPIS